MMAPGIMDISSSDLELVEDHFGEGRTRPWGCVFPVKMIYTIKNMNSDQTWS